MNKFLVTAFEPFGGELVNSTIKLMELLPDKIGNTLIIKKILPVVYKKAFEKLKEYMEDERPQVVIATGQASGKISLHFERFALNVMHARLRDNRGNRPEDEPIDPQGPAAYRCALDLKKMADASYEAGCPAVVSHFSGTFVCNDLYYRLLQYTEGSGVQGLFVHMPAAPGQVKGGKVPGLETELCRDGMIAAIQAGFAGLTEGEEDAQE